MFELVVAFLVGLFIGWNFPQPSWAVAIQEWIMGWFRKLPESPKDDQEKK